MSKNKSKEFEIAKLNSLAKNSLDAYSKGDLEFLLEIPTWTARAIRELNREPKEKDQKVPSKENPFVEEYGLNFCFNFPIFWFSQYD